MKTKYPIKSLTIFLTILFFSSAIQYTCANEIMEDELLSYGIIVPLMKIDNASIQNQINCRVRNMINDLLREQIPVYWTKINISINVSEPNDIENFYEKFLEKGTFIIPFTGEVNHDAKILSIVGDYNQSSEIENESLIPVYLTIDKLVDIPVIILSEVKIAQYHSRVTSVEMCYLDVAKKSGFLTFEMMTCNTLKHRLNNSAFSVLSWAGGDWDYASFCKSTMGTSIRDDIFYNVSKTVRKFVSKGGGYVGSCHAAFRATCGFEIGKIPILFKAAVYNPKIPTILVFALAEAALREPKVNFSLTKVKIVNDSHPVIFNVDPVTYDNYAGGGLFFHIGKKVEIIANYTDTGTVFDNTPCWISSNFGDGKAVLFSPHPEISAWQNKSYRYNAFSVVSNSYFYTSSKGFKKLYSEFSQPLNFITGIWKNTTIDLGCMPSIEVFEIEKQNINQTIIRISQLLDRIKEIQKQINDIADKRGVNINNGENKTYLGYKSTWVKDSILNYNKEFLNESIVFLTNISNIYPFIKNNSNFLDEINYFKKCLSSRINKTKEVLFKCEIICNKYSKLLKIYNSINRNLTILEILLQHKGHQLYTQVFCCFDHIPNIYFDSLRFLRHQWYDYETIVALEGNN